MGAGSAEADMCDERDSGLPDGCSQSGPIPFNAVEAGRFDDLPTDGPSCQWKL
jgi:hypothetical protein